MRLKRHQLRVPSGKSAGESQIDSVVRRSSARAPSRFEMSRGRDPDPDDVLCAFGRCRGRDPGKAHLLRVGQSAKRKQARGHPPIRSETYVMQPG